MTTAETNSIPLWQRVISVDRTSDSGLNLQIPDLATARDFWNIYRLDSRERNNAISVVFEDFLPLVSADIENMIPESSWYAFPDHSQSVHGRQHSLRVALYAEIIGQKVGLSKEERNILRAAALIHDTYRETDLIDSDHGKRASQGWRGRLELLKQKGLHIKEVDEEAVLALCEYHEKDWQDIPYSIQKKYGKLLKPFMAADALDRYRAPNEKWWPDPQYFNHDKELQQIFTNLMPFARYFTLWTEYYRLSYPFYSLEEVIKIIGREVGIITNELTERKREL